MLHSGVGLKASLFKKRDMRDCIAYAFKDISLVFTSVDAYQNVIAPSHSSEEISIVGARTPLQFVGPSWLSPKLLTEIDIEGARERHKQVMKHRPKYLGRVRIYLFP